MAVLAVLLRALLDPVLGHVAFYVTVYMTVAFCAVVCGIAPAVLSALVGLAGILFWFVDPRHSFLLFNRSDIHGLVGSTLVCAVLIALGGANRDKQLRLAGSIGALTNEAAERKHAEAELQWANNELEQRVRERTAELSQALAELESEIQVREQTGEQLRRLSVRLMTLQDEERRRIARELHDTTGQTLAALKMTVSLLQQAGPGRADFPRLVDEINVLADGALQEIRTTSYLLHPPLLDEGGIALAAQWLVEGFAKRSGIQIQCDIPQDIQRPPRHCELVLFRVLQESLTNIHRHSGASAVSIHLKIEAHEIKLDISDNGNGIPEDRLKNLQVSGSSGVGTAGMRERVRELGGCLEIRSGKAGTTVSAMIPLPKPESAAAKGRVSAA